MAAWKKTANQYRDALAKELTRMESPSFVISCNVPLTQRATFTPGFIEPPDRGVAVYFARKIQALPRHQHSAAGMFVDPSGEWIRAADLDGVLAIFAQPCQWCEDEDGIFQTACGHSFTFEADGPRENGCRCCFYCGHPLEPVRYQEPAPVEP